MNCHYKCFKHWLSTCMCWGRCTPSPLQCLSLLSLTLCLTVTFSKRCSPKWVTRRRSAISSHSWYSILVLLSVKLTKSLVTEGGIFCIWIDRLETECNWSILISCFLSLSWRWMINLKAKQRFSPSSESADGLSWSPKWWTSSFLTVGLTKSLCSKMSDSANLTRGGLFVYRFVIAWRYSPVLCYNQRHTVLQY